MTEARERPEADVERILDILAPILGIVDADAAIEALTAAGFTIAPPGSRIVPEGEVDAETVERCAVVCDEWGLTPGSPAKVIAAALRSLVASRSAKL